MSIIIQKEICSFSEVVIAFCERKKKFLERKMIFWSLSGCQSIFRWNTNPQIICRHQQQFLEFYLLL